jgi:hypothetical protein
MLLVGGLRVREGESRTHSGKSAFNTLTQYSLTRDFENVFANPERANNERNSRRISVRMVRQGPNRTRTGIVEHEVTLLNGS